MKKAYKFSLKKLVEEVTICFDQRFPCILITFEGAAPWTTTFVFWTQREQHPHAYIRAFISSLSHSKRVVKCFTCGARVDFRLEPRLR